MKTLLPITMTAILCITALSGCQSAPEASNDKDIWHAQSGFEQQIADTVEENEEEKQQLSGSVYEGVLGTTDNKMSIKASIPDIPANVYQITLKPDEELDMDVLNAFLDSSSGNIEDVSQELLEEIKNSDYYNVYGDDDETFLYSKFGDHSALQLKDGEREASFLGHTSASYVDYNLRDTYFGNVDTSTMIPVDRSDTEAGFSVEEAEQILLDKLKPLGITEVAIQRIVFNEGSGYSYYELDFVPFYEGMAMVSEIAGHGLGELYPWGGACVTPEGVALLNLSSFCGKIVGKEPVTVLSFEQAEKILEQYLDKNMIQVDERLTFNNIKLEYFPVPNLSPAEGEIEYRSELELIPIWHIYIPLGDYIDRISQIGGAGDMCYNICINAVTGELEKVW